METIILSGLTVSDLLLRIEQVITTRLGNQVLHEKPKATAYLTRKEVAGLLKITLPTLHDWTKLGWLPSYKIGNRVLYRREEVEASLSQVYAHKHKKGGVL